MIDRGDRFGSGELRPGLRKTLQFSALRDGSSSGLGASTPPRGRVHSASASRLDGLRTTRRRSPRPGQRFGGSSPALHKRVASDWPVVRPPEGEDTLILQVRFRVAATAAERCAAAGPPLCREARAARIGIQRSGRRPASPPQSRPCCGARPPSTASERRRGVQLAPPFCSGPEQKSPARRTGQGLSWRSRGRFRLAPEPG